MSVWVMKPDPPLRADHRCSAPHPSKPGRLCLQPLPQVAITHEDPFCSAPCARRYHKVVE